ncbi:MAG TPA: S9 family peptidase [Jatrophihabitans sp.]|nr:S9 family peptidase [Jatrophihabitans sp.]
MSRIESATPPTAARKPVQRTFHGDVFVDDYEWLRDKSDPEVIGYLEAENAYTEASTAGLAPLQERIFGEIVERTKQTDLTVPVRHGAFWYYVRTVEGQQYRVYCRVPATGDTPPDLESGAGLAEEQVLLDGNAVAAGSEFFSMGAYDVSPDGNLLAYSIDLTGDERFTLHLKDLRTGEDLADEIADTHYGTAWSADCRFVFYVTVDESWRPYRVWRHAVGTPAADDVLVHTEQDDRFWLGVELSRNERAVQITIGSKLTSEVWLVDAHSPESAPVVVAPRREGVEYSVEHAGDRLLILHNAHHPNFELSSAGLDRTGPEHWQGVLAGSDERRLLSVDAFAEHAVLHERRDGLANLSVLLRTGDGFGAPEPIEFGEPIYRAVPGANPEWTARTYRFTFGSLVTPDTIYDYDVAGKELLLRKQSPVLGGVDLGAYRQWRDWAVAPDGTRVPLSLVGRADVAQDGNAPVVLYGYGSYEHSLDPTFSIPRLSLLDRGVVYAIAHIRGGGELGRRWYDDGKMLAKRNTFTDFVAAAEHLVATGWTTPERIVAQGGSAGGLLMGAVANLAPQAFGAIVAHVPFVDALTSILDPSLPLTVTEWEEWGNPLADPEVYAYMKSYTPYENVAAADYPAILAITSLNDTRVLYVEPAKWVAKLRATVTGDRPILLRTEMEAGHAGRSGRYDAWRETAFYLAWELDRLGLA